MRQGFKSKHVKRSSISVVPSSLQKMYYKDDNTTGNYSVPCWKISKIMSGQNSYRGICTNTGATLNLHACEKDYSDVGNHAIVRPFFCFQIRDECALSTKTKRYGMRQ